MVPLLSCEEKTRFYIFSMSNYHLYICGFPWFELQQVSSLFCEYPVPNSSNATWSRHLLEYRVTGPRSNWRWTGILPSPGIQNIESHKILGSKGWQTRKKKKIESLEHFNLCCFIYFGACSKLCICYWSGT